MAESLGSRQPLARRLLASALYGALAAGIATMVLYEDPGGETGSPAQLREIIENFRSKRRETLVRRVESMREMAAAMATIRDSWTRKAGITCDLDDALDDVDLEHRERAKTDIAGLGLIEVYEVGRSVEQEMVTLYREFLAARMVGVQPGYEYVEAYNASATPRPTRPHLDRAVLYRDITSTREGGGLTAFKAEIGKATVELIEMLENCERLLVFTRKSDTNLDDGISVDMSVADIAMVEYRGPALLPDELDYTHEANVGNFEAIPGRRLVTGGRINDWLYVDSWYIIGPFPSDRRRQNLDVRFGPEANVNLDDVFLGKELGDGSKRKVRWEYKKTGSCAQGTTTKQAYWKIEPKTVVRSGIYYAFTEVYSDAPRDVWIATGTDDYGKLWINDELVWKSPKNRKPYNATENIQLVKFGQGQNKVLYRVENAGGTMGFSLLMRLAMQ